MARQSFNLFTIVFLLASVSTAQETKKLQLTKPKLRMEWLSSLTNKGVVDIKNPEEVAILEIVIFEETGKKKPAFDEMAIISLARFKNLKTIIIWSDELKYVGLKNLSELKSLEAIVLYETNISSRGIKHLSKLKNLKSLGFYEPNVEPNDRDEIPKLLPDVLIEFYAPRRKNPKIFDWNGCLATWFRRQHLRLSNFKN